MKFLSVVILIFVSNLIIGQTTSNKSVVITIEKSAILDTNCQDLPCQAIIIKRPDQQTNVLALFPLGGTQTDVSLYSIKDYSKYKSNPKELNYSIKKHDKKMIAEGQPLTINMTDLQDGDYVAEYISCSASGIVKLTLKTESKN